MSMIEIKNVSKWYGDFQVLKNCSVNVEKGEVVVVCGPSGSGKSTLIKTVNALEPFQQGEIRINGISVGDPKTDLAKLRSHVGMVFQSFNLFNNKHSLEPLHHLLTTKIFIFFPSHSHTSTLSIVIERRYASSRDN